MTIYITNIPSASDKLSSGHIFWEIFTCHILSMLIEKVIPVYNSRWDKSNILTTIMKKTKIEDIKYNKTITISKYYCFNSLNFQQFSELKQTMLNAEKKYKNILVNLTNVCSIHPDMLCEWFNKKLINENIYTEKCKPLLEKLYFSENESTQLNVFSIHMRRGDLYNYTYNEGYDLEYYKNIIKIVKKKLNIPIHIYTENTGNNTTTKLNQSGDYQRGIKGERKNTDHNDIDIFKNIDNVFIKKGDLSDFNQHFNEMCRSKYLMLGLSSMSLLAGFINKGKIIVDERYIKSRKNLFKNIKIIPRFCVYDKIEKLNDYLN